MLLVKKRKTTPVPNGFTKATFADKKLKLANWLSHKTNGYSPLQKKIGLFIFCLLAGGLGISTLLLLQNMHVPNVEAPKNFVSMPLRPSESIVPVIVSKSDFIHLEAARKILDSLKYYDSIRFHQIMIHQPDILKNIELLESVYHAQNK